MTDRDELAAATGICTTVECSTAAELLDALASRSTYFGDSHREEPAQRLDLVGKILPVDTFHQRWRGPALIKFIVPRAEANAVLWYLASERITAARLFPGYAGAARSVLESRLRRSPKL